MPETSARDTATIRALIVDDERLGRDAIRLALESEEDFRVVGECGSCREAVEMIRSLEPDVVFLDVQMSGGDGFDVIDRVGPDNMPVVIFVTAFDEHALRAFDVHAMDYVLKPVDRERFSRAVTRAREQIKAMDALDRQPGLADVVSEVRHSRESQSATASPGMPLPGRYLSRIAVRVDERVVFVRTIDIDWFGGSGNYVTIHVAKQEYRLRFNLRDLIAQLDPVRFRRIHRSTIVNVDRIREVQPWFGGDYIVILHDGQQLRASRTFASDLLKPLQ